MSLPRQLARLARPASTIRRLPIISASMATPSITKFSAKSSFHRTSNHSGFNQSSTILGSSSRFFSNSSHEEKNASPLAIVKLKNGSEVAETVLRITMISLISLKKENPPAFLDLFLKCQNPDEALETATEVAIKRYRLIEDGEIHQTTRDIMLSAVTQGEDLFDFTFGSPIEEKTNNLTKKM